MFVIDNTSKTPIYEQVKTQILALISSGVLKPGDKLPSLRALSASMHLNINTIKKVFAELENDGVIISVIGSGSYIADTALRNPQILKKAETQTVQQICQNTFFDALRYVSSPKYEYKEKFCGKDRLTWSTIHMILCAASTLLFLIIAYGIIELIRM
jgi:GntR family transcriptional regulator